MITLPVLLRFSRPHTIIGTIVSIVALYAIVCDRTDHWQPLLLVSALLVGITCNLFIVGLNQVADVEIDRINKPYLPLPAGDLSIPQAWGVVHAALVVSLLAALLVSPWLFAVVGIATFIGWAYSMPPFRLKRRHLPAAIAISTVRGVLINLGGFMVYDNLANGSVMVPAHVWMLAAFITAFSICIAWLKDLADVPGDARYGIITLAVRYSPRTALFAGHLLISGAYIGTLVFLGTYIPADTEDGVRTQVLFWGHLSLFALFLLNMLAVRTDRLESVKRFYTRFWLFFFAEYLLFLFAYIITNRPNA